MTVPTFEIDTGADGHEYYEFDGVNNKLDEFQSLKPRVYLSDDGRLVAFEDLEFGVNSVKAMWVDIDDDEFDIVEGADDSLIRTFPQGYGSGDQHFAGVSGWTEVDGDEPTNGYLVTFQEGQYPHNSILAAAYMVGDGEVLYPEDHVLADPVDLTADLPFPVSQWKPDCKVYGYGVSALGAVGFTTQDHEGEAVVVYLRLNYPSNPNPSNPQQPIYYTDLIRLTSGEKIKMVRMSGLVRYEYPPINFMQD